MNSLAVWFRCVEIVRLVFLFPLALATISGLSLERVNAQQPKVEETSADPPAGSEEEATRKVGELLDRAAEKFRNGDFAACQQVLVEAKLLDPKLEAPAVILSRLFAANGQLGDAISKLDTYLAKNDDPDGFLRLGEIALGSGRLTESFLLLERAKALAANAKWDDQRRQDFLRILTRLRGATAQSREKLEDAAKIYRDHLANDPELWAANWELGKVEVLMGKTDAGFQRMKEAFEKDRALTQPELALAVIFANRKDDAAAEAWFQKSIAEPSASLACWVEYAKWLLMSDRPSDAKALVSKSPAEMQESRDLRFILGLAARFDNDLATAESIFSSLHQANLEDMEVADQLALVLIESADEGKRGRALQLAEANVRRAPGAETALATAGWVHFRLGSTDLAERFLTEATKLGRITPQTAYYIAKMLEYRGRNQDALKLFETAAEESGVFVQRREVAKRLKDLQR